MADTKITALTALTGADPANDVIPIVDVSDTTMAASGTTKKISVNNILGASGTATLASATITGDLTVRTNKLFVNASGAAVGTTSIFADFQVQRSTNARLEIDSAASSLNYQVLDNARTGYLQHIVYASQHLWFNGVTEAMRLNSTGLGVGVSPSYKLDVRGSDNSVIAQFGGTNRQVRFVTAANGGFDNANFIVRHDSSVGGFLWQNNNGSNTLLTIDSSGNVGIGVTPSAWASYKALQVGSIGSLSSTTGATIVGNNWFYDGASKYITTAASTIYEQGAGTHVWFNAPSGTAGNAITFTQAMTLDASGNLLIGKTATNYLTVGCELKPNGVFQSTQSGSTNANSCWDTYSTGAGAYRFYVGMSGTVFATNTTISAISDARLKENVQDIDVGLGAILALKPRKFDWKDGKGKNIKGDRGFIAQEFETVFPNLIDEWKENAPEGEAPYKSVRQDLIPVLVKAIQELAAEVNALKNA